jgi:hypothetical protein
VAGLSPVACEVGGEHAAGEGKLCQADLILWLADAMARGV